MINKLLKLSIKTKITMTIFIIVLFFSLGAIYLIKNSLTQNTKTLAINITKDLIHVNEAFIIKSILEDDYWSIYKVLQSLNSLDIIQSIGFINENNKIIAHTDTKNYQLDQIFDLKSFKGTTVPLKNEEVILGNFVVIINNNAVKHLFKNSTTQIIIYMLLLGILSFLIAYFISKRILKRLEILSFNAQQIQQGKLDKVIENRFIEKDEIAYFQESMENILNQLNDSLKNEQSLKKFYHEILEGLNELIVITDENFIIKYQNEHRFKNIVLNKVSLNNAIIEKIKEYIKKEVNHFSFKTKLSLNEVLYLYIGIVKIKNRYVFSFHDITKLKSLEEKQQLTNSFKLIGEISSSVVHEIKNYMQPIKLLIEQDEIDKEDSNRILTIIVKIDMLINRFLNSGKPIDKSLSSIIDLKAIIEDKLFLFSTEFEKKNIALEKNYEQNLFTLMGEYDFEMIIVNLIKNALEASPEDGIINIKTFEKGSYSVLNVSNQGEHIDSEMLKNISKPFFTTKEQGNGIGLYTIYKIVYLYGGFIEVQSKTNNTSFTIYLPQKDQ